MDVRLFHPFLVNAKKTGKTLTNHPFPSMKSVVPLILALSVSICEASPTENPVPWVEKKAHTAKEGQLFSTRCLTPESSFYISYSVYPKYDSRGESNKKEFAQGFYTYRPPERIVREMKTFSNHDRTPYAKTGRYVVMDSDSPCYQIAMNMAMANRFGHPYSFLDQKRQKNCSMERPKRGPFLPGDCHGKSGRLDCRYRRHPPCKRFRQCGSWSVVDLSRHGRMQTDQFIGLVYIF